MNALQAKEKSTQNGCRLAQLFQNVRYYISQQKTHFFDHIGRISQLPP